jgi:hypothetical protein
MTCPVCAYKNLPYPPQDYNICPCCGTEFGNDDAHLSHHQLREVWVAGGASWFFNEPPEHWNPWTQLIRAGLPVAASVPNKFRAVSFQSSVVMEQATLGNILAPNYNVENLPRIAFAA